MPHLESDTLHLVPREPVLGLVRELVRAPPFPGHGGELSFYMGSVLRKRPLAAASRNRPLERRDGAARSTRIGPFCLQPKRLWLVWPASKAAARHLNRFVDCRENFVDLGLFELII